MSVETSTLPIGDWTPCTCPTAWWGTVPPYCPLHNPGTGWVPSTVTTGELRIVPQRLFDEDVERIAVRVAELLKPKRKRAQR